MLNYEDELSLEEIWFILRPALIPALLLSVAFALFAYFWASSRPRVFRATAKVLVVEGGGGYSSVDAANRVPPLDPEAYREVAVAYPILQPLGLRPGDKRLRVRVIKGRRSSVLALSVEDVDPERAAERANVWAEALVAWEDTRARQHFEKAEASLKARLSVIDQQLTRARASGRADQLGPLERLKTDLLRDLDMVRALKISARGNLQVLEMAQPPSRPVAPRPVLASVLGGTLAFFLVIFGAFLRQALDPRLRSSEEGARLTGLLVLSEFPRVPPGTGRVLSKEAANYLRTNLDQQLPEVTPKIITVTSAEEGAGKSSVALALARAYARTGRPALLLDADLRRPILDEELGVSSEEIGLISLLQDASLPIEPHAIQPFLDFLPAGGTIEDASELLTEHWRAFLARVLELGRYEVVVIDSAPVLPVADTLVIVPHASGVLLVAAEGKTHRRHLIAAHELLKRVGAKVLGLAVTHVREGVWFLSGYRGYGYGHGSGKGGAAPALDRRPPA